ncbi:hypothetical protein ACIP79_00595 [Streptomyces sp. NPDC088747]|uniref:hypothetical protein n=1 Tax=Streptomyces sp. NPDC088747 TaxID=3365886 RepID=UPI00381A7BEC
MTEQTARILTEAADSVERNVRCQTHTEANGKSNAVEHLRRLAAEARPVTGNPSVVTDRVLSEVLAERIRQDARWGEQNHPDGTGSFDQKAAAVRARADCQLSAADGKVTWAHIAREEDCEALAESDPVRLREELIQAAAVKVAWIEALDRRALAARCQRCYGQKVVPDLSAPPVPWCEPPPKPCPNCQGSEGG